VSDDRPVLLDLCCGGGGAGAGYARAGFRVIGVDIEHQPNYPYEFVKGDALALLPELIAEYHPAALHASWPCQKHTPLDAMVAAHARRRGEDRRRPVVDLIPAGRAAMRATGLPYVIENVATRSAGLLDPITLCGAMFDLDVYRHRHFESNVPLTAPAHSRHVRLATRNGYLPTPERPVMTVTGRNAHHARAWVTRAAEVMGTPWLAEDLNAVCEAIPPTYTEHIGRQLMTRIKGGPQNMITTKLAPPLRVDCPRDKPWKRPIMDDPITGQRTTYQRVTTLAGMIDDTYSLTNWKMRQVAKGVAWRDDLRIAAATTDDSTRDGKAALDEICEKALDAAGGGAGAAMGTAFHRVTQIADAYPDVPVESYCPPELRQELSAYVALIKTHGLILRPEYQERTGICPDAGVAGTWDDLVLGGPCGCGRYHVGDKKSGQHEFEYGQGKIAAQLAMYARMTTLWLATGGGYEAPPAICPEVGYVLYVPIGRSQEARVYPVDLVEGWRRVELAMAIREARSAKRGLFGAPLMLATSPGTTADEGEEYVGLSMAQVKPKRARRTKAQIEADKANAAAAAPVSEADFPTSLAAYIGTEPVLDLNDPADAAIHESEHRHDGTAFLMNGELKPGPAELKYDAGASFEAGELVLTASGDSEHDVTPLDDALTALDEAVTVAEVTAEAAVALLQAELGAEVVPATVERVRPDKGQLDREREAAYAGLRNGTTAQTEMERGKLADAITTARGQDDLVTAYGLWSAHWTPEHDQMAVRRLISLTGTREGLEKIWEQYQSVWTDDLTAAGNARLAELARL